MNAQQLNNFEKKHDYLICIDSDGCVFDTMEIKHKECFCPSMIEVWGLQSVSRYARETFEYVNLYSKDRGINRFPAFLKTLDLMCERPEVKRRGFVKPDVSSLRSWISNETSLGNPALMTYCLENPEDKIMKTTLDWSMASNVAIQRIVHHVPPFEYVRESLKKISSFADIVVVSATQSEALKREWAEHDLDKYVSNIYGQEHGTKSQCIQRLVTKLYKPNNTIMLGDALGDYAAAVQNAVHFYPIVPNKEDESWKKFFTEISDKFQSNTYEGEYEKQIISHFQSCLPDFPPWTL